MRVIDRKTRIIVISMLLVLWAIATKANFEDRMDPKEIAIITVVATYAALLIYDTFIGIKGIIMVLLAGFIFFVYATDFTLGEIFRRPYESRGFGFILASLWMMLFFRLQPAQYDPECGRCAGSGVAKYRDRYFRDCEKECDCYRQFWRSNRSRRKPDND